MLNVLRRWHWTLLHRILGLPDHDHTEPHAPLSAILRSHPLVPAHHRRRGQRSSQSLQSQLDRERQRQPRILKSWQSGIGAYLGRQLARRRSSDERTRE